MNKRLIAPGIAILEERTESFGEKYTLKYILFGSVGETEEQTVYSIFAAKKQGNIEKSTDFVYDAVRDASSAHKIFTLLAEGLVTPITLRDVIEDFISE
ncbi:MAG: hypothetical protein HFE30_04770 [Clostridiales bacterium]|nr:hypothetical protein [Clostridiales bacterium]